MAKEIERIAKLFQRNWDGPMWYGGQLSENLRTSWEKAFQKPKPGFSY